MLPSSPITEQSRHINKTSLKSYSDARF